MSEGLGYIRDPLSKLSSDIVVGTNHYSYDVESLINLRNLSIHGSCIAAPGTIRGDIELLHELRKLIYGIPIGESNSLGKAGPISGAIDRYFEELKSGDKNRCDRLASAAISALHFLKLQNGDWPFAKTLINDLMQDIANNKSNGQPPISGSHTRQNDCFQLYK